MFTNISKSITVVKRFSKSITNFCGIYYLHIFMTHQSISLLRSWQTYSSYFSYN